MFFYGLGIWGNPTFPIVKAEYRGGLTRMEYQWVG
jgi:hypothetical protein